VNAALLTAAFSIKLRRVISFFSGKSFFSVMRPSVGQPGIMPRCALHSDN
jgi:hypothetical protein